MLHLPQCFLLTCPSKVSILLGWEYRLCSVSDHSISPGVSLCIQILILLDQLLMSPVQAFTGPYLQRSTCAENQHLHLQRPVMFLHLPALWVRGFLSCFPSSSSVLALELLMRELRREEEEEDAAHSSSSTYTSPTLVTQEVNKAKQSCISTLPPHATEVS